MARVVLLFVCLAASAYEGRGAVAEAPPPSGAVAAASVEPVCHELEAVEHPFGHRALLQIQQHTTLGKLEDRRLASGSSALLSGRLEAVLRLLLGEEPLADHKDLIVFWVSATLSYVISALVAVLVWWWFLRDGRTSDVLEPLGAEGHDTHSSKLRPGAEAREADEEEVEEVEDLHTLSSPISLRSRQLKRRAAHMYQQRDSVHSRWVRDEEQQRQRLQLGAAALCTISHMALCFEVLRVFWHPTCIPFNRDLRFLSYSVLLAGTCGTLYCLYRFRPRLYVCLCAFYFFYLPALTMPPFHWSCQQLEQQCYGYGSRYVRQAVSIANCSLGGQTAQQLVMTMQLMLPWLLPQFIMMHCVWVWIMGVYLVWTLLYEDLAGDKGVDFPIELRLFRIALICVTMLFAYGKKSVLETSQKDRYIADLKQKEASKNIFGILSAMLPEHVIVPMLRHDIVAEQIDVVSILFIVIDDFDASIARCRSAKDTLQFLNQQFTQIDEMCMEHQVMKIETVSEEYVCCVGVSPADREITSQKGHESIIGRLFGLASEILELLQTEELRFKMGIHTGSIVGGVIGQKLPRYRLFGDTINTAARMMQKSQPGQLQCGQATYAYASKAGVRLVEQGFVEMKGKGQVMTYRFLVDDDDESHGSSDVPLPPLAPRAGRTGSLGLRPHVEGAASGSPQSACADAAAGSAVVAVALRGPAPDTAAGRGRSPPPHESSALQGNERPRSPSPNTGRLNRLRPPPLSAALLQQLDQPGSPQVAPRRQLSTHTNMAKLSQTASKPHLDLAHVLKEITDQKQHSDWRWFFPSKLGFTSKMEQQWWREFHEDEFCHQLLPRMDLHFGGLAVLTFLEAFYMVQVKVWQKPHDLIPGTLRVPMFLFCRLCALGAIGGVRAFFYYRPVWVLKHIRSSQALFITMQCVVLLNIFVSYDVVITSSVDFGRLKQEGHGLDRAPPDQIFAPLYMLVYFVFMRFQKCAAFYPTLIFIPLALLIMVLMALREEKGVYFPVPVGQFLFIVMTASNCVLAYWEEQGSRASFKARKATSRIKQNIGEILATMMPPLVLKSMRDSGDAVHLVHQYEHATIAQSDLCGFTKLSSSKTPAEVVQVVSELFGEFDKLTDVLGVYKVETVGDAYIAGMAETPLTRRNSPTKVVQFALQMVVKVREWSMREGVPLDCRVGVHHGACIGGIVGTDMVRYHLFGELMQSLEALESTGVPGCVHASGACKRAVEQEVQGSPAASAVGLRFVQRDVTSLVTSKGEEHQLSEVGGVTYLLEVP